MLPAAAQNVEIQRSWFRRTTTTTRSSRVRSVIIRRDGKTCLGMTKSSEGSTRPRASVHMRGADSALRHSQLRGPGSPIGGALSFGSRGSRRSASALSPRSYPPIQSELLYTDAEQALAQGHGVRALTPQSPLSALVCVVRACVSRPPGRARSGWSGLSSLEPEERRSLFRIARYLCRAPGRTHQRASQGPAQAPLHTLKLG